MAMIGMMAMIGTSGLVASAVFSIFYVSARGACAGSPRACPARVRHLLVCLHAAVVKVVKVEELEEVEELTAA